MDNYWYFTSATIITREKSMCSRFPIVWLHWDGGAGLSDTLGSQEVLKAAFIYRHPSPMYMYVHMSKIFGHVYKLKLRILWDVLRVLN
jgi:hypothetical protein